MAVFTTYEQVGIKEDIADTISNIDPTNTPFQTSIKDHTVHNTFHQWQEDHLRSAALNALSDGFTATDGTLVATKMRANYVQILGKVIRVSGSADKVSTYGRAKELAYQLGKAGAEIKRDLELSMVGNAQIAVAGNDTVNGAGTARQFASYQAQLAGTTLAQANSTTAADSGFETVYYADNATFVVPGTPTTAALIEDAVLTVALRLYNNGAEATLMSVKPNDALKVAAFALRAPASVSNTTGRQRLLDGTTTRIVNVVDVYKSPYGELKVVQNRFQKTTDALVYDPKLWTKTVLRPWFRETLAKTGDNTAMMIVGEYGLKHKNWRASALITDLA